jgi:phenylpropionate dioxygenase-like ring-hydroxylating dioxygenase large terminal subunit
VEECIGGGRSGLPIPNGWFAVAVGDEIAPGQVAVRHYFGQDLVVFRSESGVAAVLDPHCPHLGAHLGHGGRVEGERIRCPFHGWAFDLEGTCREIPYAKRIPPGARTKRWPVQERYGFVFVWRDADGGEPWFDLPEVPEATSPDWSTHQRYEWTIRAHGQELGENGVDPAHFRFVHGTLNVPVMEAKEDGPYRTAHQPVEMRTPRGDVSGAIEARSAGMGFSATRFTGICETLELATATPIDAATTHVRYAFTQPRVAGQDPKGGVAAAIIRDIVKQTNEDVPIWENKIHRERPVLCDGDGPIAEYRRWCRQFYPPGSQTGRGGGQTGRDQAGER